MRAFAIYFLTACAAFGASITQVPLMVSTNGVIKYPTNLTVMGHLAWGTNAPLTVPSLTTTQRDALSGTNGMLIYNTSNTRFERYEAGSWTTFAGGIGEANTASNLGTNGATVQGLYDSKSGVDLRFRSLLAGTGITLTSNATTVEIAASASGGTVTSVALTAPSFLSVAGSPITGSGTLALSLANQTSNTIFAGPTSGGAAAPTFRALVSADIPDLSATYQPLDADLTTYAGITPSANVQSLLGAANYSAMRTLLSLVPGTDVQAYDADLTTYAGITPSANVQTLLGSADYAAFKSSLSLNNVENTALSTWAGTANITTLGTISSGTWEGTAVAVNKGGTGSTTASDARTALGLAIGTDIQAYSANLANWSALTTNMLRTVTNNLSVYVAAGVSTNVINMDLAASTNILNAAVTFLHATNGVAGFEKTHVRWLWAGGADRTLTIPSGWKTNVFSAVPASITNGTIVKMYVTTIGDTSSSANQTNVFVSFEFYK